MNETTARNLSPLSWDGFTLDRREGELLGPGGNRVHLRRQSLAVLLAMARVPGFVVSQSALMEEVWGRSVVTGDSLVQCVLEIRRALGPVASAVIQTVHRRGYAFDLTARTGGDRPPALSKARRGAQLPFVGRHAEMDCLLSASAQEGGPGQLVLISGEPGVGKSRLMREACESAKHSGALVLGFKCHEIEGGVANGVACRFVERLVASSESSALLQLELAHRVELTRLVPWHAQRLGIGSELQSAVPAQFPARLRVAVVALCASVCKSRDLILALDDAHWLDATSAYTLFALAEAVGQHRVFFWATFRPDEIASSANAVRLLDALKALDHVLELQLQRLRPADVEAIARHLGSGQIADPDYVAWLVRESLGNPFYLAELIQAKKHPPAEQMPESAAVADVPVLPATILDAVLRRARHLPETAMSLLEAAAVAGAAARFDVMCLVALRPRGASADALTLLLASGWLVEDSGGERYVFGHDKLREAIYTSLPAAKRSMLHSRLAHALLAASTPERRPDHAVIAVHARRGGELVLARKLFEQAGDVAHQDFQLRAADQQYSEALALNAPVAVAAQAQGRVALLKKRGAIRSMLGANRDAEADLRAAIELASKTSQNSGAKGRSRGLDAELGRLQMELGIMLQRQHRLNEATDAFLRTLKLAAQLQDTEMAAAAHSWLGDIDWMMERNRSAREHFQRVLSEHEHGSYAMDAARTKALFGMGQCAIMDARPAQADIYLDQAIGRIQAPAESFFMCAWHALKAWNRVGGHSLGDPDAAHEHFALCLTLSQKAELQWYGVPCEIGFSAVDAARGHFERAIDRLHAVLRLPADVQNNKWRLSAGVWLAASYLDAGQPAAALDAARAAVRALASDGPFMFAARLPALMLQALTRLGQATECQDPAPLITRARQDEQGYAVIASLEARTEWLHACGAREEVVRSAEDLHSEATNRGLRAAQAAAIVWRFRH